MVRFTIADYNHVKIFGFLPHLSLSTFLQITRTFLCIRRSFISEEFIVQDVSYCIQLTALTWIEMLLRLSFLFILKLLLVKLMLNSTFVPSFRIVQFNLDYALPFDRQPNFLCFIFNSLCYLTGIKDYWRLRFIIDFINSRYLIKSYLLEQQISWTVLL